MSAHDLAQGMETSLLHGHKQVLEDWREIDTPESDKEEHGDVLEGIKGTQS
jgi:hypothetical protein